MRYSPTLDRILWSLELLRQGDSKASAQVLADALEDPEYERDVFLLSNMQKEAFLAQEASTVEEADPQPDGEAHDGCTAGHRIDTLGSDGEQDGWDDSDCAGVSPRTDSEHGTVESVVGSSDRGSENLRRTSMMLRNLKVLRGD